MILGAPSLFWLLGFNLLLLTSGWPWIKSAGPTGFNSSLLKGFNGRAAKAWCGPLDDFHMLDFGCFTTRIFFKETSCTWLHQPSQVRRRGILVFTSNTYFCLNFRLLWAGPKTENIKSWVDFETKPEAIMFGSFAKHQFEMREKPSLPPRQRHNSAHRGFFVNNTVDRIKA